MIIVRYRQARRLFFLAYSTFQLNSCHIVRAGYPRPYGYIVVYLNEIRGQKTLISSIQISQFCLNRNASNLELLLTLITCGYVTIYLLHRNETQEINLRQAITGITLTVATLLGISGASSLATPSDSFVTWTANDSPTEAVITGGPWTLAQSGE